MFALQQLTKTYKFKLDIFHEGALYGKDGVHLKTKGLTSLIVLSKMGALKKNTSESAGPSGWMGSLRKICCPVWVT